MKKNHKLILFLITFGFILVTSTVITVQTFTSFDNTAMNYKFQNLKPSESDYSNVTIISDGYLGDYWNNDLSYEPNIAVDDSGAVHVVWYDHTDGAWGTDIEIMYASYTEATGWSNATVISDGYMDIYWNDDGSYYPDIAVDDSGAVHVVWFDYTDGTWGADVEIMYTSYTGATGWSNVTVISDGYSGVYWNDGGSYYPDIAVDSLGAVHVVWQDSTYGIWGTDFEIMYASYIEATGWSNATVISDGYMDIYWNDDDSRYPDIAVDNSGAVHIVWYDYTDGAWGTDFEIMYASYTEATGWSNATVVSDGYMDIYWNDGNSMFPDIAVDDSGAVHVVWYDTTDGIWGTDTDIMYASYTEATGWSNATVISDGYMDIYWNNGSSAYPDIAVDSLGAIHVVWQDYTDGIWGTDAEIMYVNYTEATGWSNVTIISDGYNGVYWNDNYSRHPRGVCYYDKLYVVWQDITGGVWGTDLEIMFTSVSIPALPGTLALSSTAETPDDDGIFNLTWSLSTNAINYSIYQYSGYINVINGSVVPVEEGLTNNSISLNGYATGTYYFIIEAVNEQGSTLSNCIMVEVEIPKKKSRAIPGYDLFIVVFAVYAVTYLFIRRKQKKIK